MSDLWIPVRFRDDEVLARCDAAGTLVEARGLVDFRYKPGGKIYRTRSDKFAPVPDAKPRVDDAAPAPAPSSGASASKAGRAGAPTAAKYGGWRDPSVAVHLWTDGACSGNPGPAGLGVRYEHGDVVVEVSEYLGTGTNNIAELTAILRGVELVEDPKVPVDVMTDSAYCIGLLTKGWKPKKNQELVATLRAAVGRLSDVQLVKVPGHAGVFGNERADALAREAVETRESRTTRV